MIMGFIGASRLDPPYKSKISTLLRPWSFVDWMSGAPTRQTGCLLSPGRTTCPGVFVQCNFLRKNPSNSQSKSYTHYCPSVLIWELLNNALWDMLSKLSVQYYLRLIRTIHAENYEQKAPHHRSETLSKTLNPKPQFKTPSQTTVNEEKWANNMNNNPGKNYSSRRSPIMIFMCQANVTWW